MQMTYDSGSLSSGTMLRKCNILLFFGSSKILSELIIQSKFHAVKSDRLLF
jgi:hypothetical protein